jgi:hypothetical protein
VKRCSRCKSKKPFSEYGSDRKARDRKNHRCNECNKENSKKLYEEKHGTAEQRQLWKDRLLEYIKAQKELGHSLREIACCTGLDKSTISYYLSGKRKVGMQAVKKWRNAGLMWGLSLPEKLPWLLDDESLKTIMDLS